MSEPQPNEFSQGPRTPRRPIDRLYEAVTLPIYAAIGAGETIFSSVDEIVTKVKTRVDKTSGPFVDEVIDTVKSSKTQAKERYASITDTAVAKSEVSSDEIKEEIRELFTEVTQSAENLFRGLVRRGYRVSRQYHKNQPPQSVNHSVAAEGPVDSPTTTEPDSPTTTDS